MTLEPDTPVRVTMGCEYCAWRVTMKGPAQEVAVFLRNLALEHVQGHHPEKVPAGDLDVAVLKELGFT